MIKKSKQREYIKECLLQHTDHPTADAVYAQVRKKIPNISLGTVYRNLSLLCSLGEALRLNLGDGKEHFDGNTCAHNHLICNGCGKVFDIYMDDINFVNEIANKNFDGEVIGNTIYFNGLCADCKKN